MLPSVMFDCQQHLHIPPTSNSLGCQAYPTPYGGLSDNVGPTRPLREAPPDELVILPPAEPESAFQPHHNPNRPFIPAFIASLFDATRPSLRGEDGRLPRGNYQRLPASLT